MMNNVQCDDKKHCMKIDKKSVFAVLAILLISVSTVCSGISGAKFLLKTDSGTSAVQHITKINTVSMVKEYPFAGESPFPKADNSIPARVKTYADKYKDSITTHLIDKSPLTNSYYYLYGSVNKSLGREIVEDPEKNVVRYNEDTLLFQDMYKFSPNIANNIADFADWLGSRGTDFLYFLPASKCDTSVAVNPFGLDTGYSTAADNLLGFFDEHNINYIQMKPILLEKNPDFLSWFFKTDHHWKVGTGLLAAQTIVTELRDNYGYDLDLSMLDRDKFDSEVYEKMFCGSMGKKATLGYAPPEDFEILYPKYDTDFCMDIPAIGRRYTGTFQETALDMTSLGYDYYNVHPYSTFMHTQQQLINMKNNMCDNGVRVLVIKDSQANAVNPFLSCCFEYLDVIDPRYFRGSVRTYIEQTSPDIVIICANDPLDGKETSWNLK